jgi:protein-S-isoprenylcysteine O-methyltransferase Ste14
MILLLKNLLFTLVVPGTVGVYVPLFLARDRPVATGTVLLGWAVMFQALLIYTLCVGICFHLFVVFYEERRLGRQFGAEYHDYCEKVDRWLPRFRRRQAG